MATGLKKGVMTAAHPHTPFQCECPPTRPAADLDPHLSCKFALYYACNSHSTTFEFWVHSCYWYIHALMGKLMFSIKFCGTHNTVIRHEIHAISVLRMSTLIRISEVEVDLHWYNSATLCREPSCALLLMN